MLELYKNIKKYRMELGITQQELALKAGYKDKSMIAKIEKGLIDLPQSKILTFSEIFDIEPSELMGYGDYLSGSDGKGDTPLERFRNSIYFKEVKKNNLLSEGFELMLHGIYDSVEEIDVDDITYYRLVRGDICYCIEYPLLETLQSRIASNIRSLIKDFNNEDIYLSQNSEFNAAHAPANSDTTDDTASSPQPRFTEVGEAKEYLLAQNHLAAFKKNGTDLPDADIIRIANEIYQNNQK